jgi:hypothetical protein
MCSRCQITDAKAIREFALAGNARLTLVSKTTGNRFTYRVRAAKDNDRDSAPAVHFVFVLTGSDNESSYSYLAMVREGLDCFRTRKSAIGAEAPSAKAWFWFWEKVVVGGREPEALGLEVWHEGRCGRCGRALTVPESIARGIGPECAGKL